MNLTAHPYAVAAELAWKTEVLSGANRPSRGRPGRRSGRPGSSGRRRRQGLHWPSRQRHTIRPA